eukprot:TRINITY_DN17476_c0_g2_i1.p1 TRINITY_DN17476_c0_g2~~TRINITY_DN17476_c0_g2_i1.p1  ORF type:complete len:346 (-),score=42.38 TRINITY_DN17476_c0_g2_i1:702-1739(-)
MNYFAVLNPEVLEEEEELDTHTGNTKMQRAKEASTAQNRRTRADSTKSLAARSPGKEWSSYKGSGPGLSGRGLPALNRPVPRRPSSVDAAQMSTRGSATSKSNGSTSVRGDEEANAEDIGFTIQGFSGISLGGSSEDAYVERERGSWVGAERRMRGEAHLFRPLVWIDLEMTGLDVKKDRILEIACIVTDGYLKNLIEGPSLVIHETEEVLEGMNDWCQKQHRESGLVERVRESSTSLAQAEREVADFVEQQVGSGPVQLAGNSVYCDLIFIREYMPRLARLFHHVVVDVSSVRALCQRWYPKDADSLPQKGDTHRALNDIKESINELKYLRGSIFKKTGPRSGF